LSQSDHFGYDNDHNEAKLKDLIFSYLSACFLITIFSLATPYGLSYNLNRKKHVFIEKEVAP